MKHLITTLVAALTATSVWADDRAALVIGNAAYQHGPRAFSAEQDVQAVADALSEAGFDVTFGLDLNRVQMRAAMDQFASKAEAAEEVVIYYSGHAMRMEGRTFLAPIDFNPVGLVAAVVDGAPGGAVCATGSKKLAVPFSFCTRRS